MNNKKIEQVSKALGDETRLRIFAAIGAGEELTCGDLVSMQGVTPATISHHLKILMDARLIECRKEGQFVHSRTVPKTIEDYSRALACIARPGKAARSTGKN